MTHADDKTTWTCINCRLLSATHVCSYWFGAHEVGPFCEDCDHKCPPCVAPVGAHPAARLVGPRVCLSAASPARQ